MKCGYVAVLGKPNAGKSSLVNFLVGEDVAIVSHRKQTTRNSILGVCNGKDYQIIFVDTPGIHHSKNNLDKFMMKNVRSAIATADVILYLFDGSQPLDEEERDYIKMLESKCDNLMLIQTKSDKVQAENSLNAIKISVKNKSVGDLVERIVALLPERSAIFDAEEYTDKSVNFLIAERVRGYLLNNLDKEIPHGVAVMVTNFSETSSFVNIDIDIICEREQHKAILIGKGGSMIKSVGEDVREFAENLLDKRCFIKLFVKVDKNWREKDTSQYGY